MGKIKNQDLEKPSLAQLHREIFNLIKEKQEEGHFWQVDYGEDYCALFRKKKNVMVLFSKDCYFKDEAIPFIDSFFKVHESEIILEKLKTGDFNDFQF